MAGYSAAGSVYTTGGVLGEWGQDIALFARHLAL